MDRRIRGGARWIGHADVRGRHRGECIRWPGPDLRWGGGLRKKTNLTDKPLSPDLLRKINAFWCATNYLSVGQIYLYDNPLLKKPLMLEHVKPRLMGHWGTTQSLNFICIHFNRIIKNYDLNMINVAQPRQQVSPSVRLLRIGIVTT